MHRCQCVIEHMLVGGTTVVGHLSCHFFYRVAGAVSATRSEFYQIYSCKWSIYSVVVRCSKAKIPTEVEICAYFKVYNIAISRPYTKNVHQT